MNRYVIDGIIRDAQAGKGVLCVIPSRRGPVRGICVDIAVIDDVYYRDQMLDLHADLTVLVAPRGGEIITYT